MATIIVTDIRICKNGVWYSLRGQRMRKSGVWHSCNTGSGVYKNGSLYALKPTAPPTPLIDNQITLRIEGSGTGNITITATSQHICTSGIVIRGMYWNEYLDDLRNFSVTISEGGSYAFALYTTPGGASELSTVDEVNPEQDSTYRYSVSF